MGFLDKAKSLGSKTVEEGKKYAEITKYNVMISSCEGQMKECKLKIGNEVAERFADQFAEDSEIMEQLTRIDELTRKIEALRAKINDIKNTSAESDDDTDVVIEQIICESSDDGSQTAEIIILPNSLE